MRFVADRCRPQPALAPALALAATLVLCACSSGSGVIAPQAVRPAAVDDAVIVVPTTLQGVPATAWAPDIGVRVFDGLQPAEPGSDAATLPVAAPAFPTIRKAETLLLPTMLARTLRASGAFGVVRVIPDASLRLPLRVSGEILQSDASILDLRITLHGADERVLFSQRYRDRATPADYPVSEGEEPFADLYRSVANDLRAVVADLSREELNGLSQLALMRFGADLSPTSFADYIDETAEGALRLLAYPAEGDPMLDRLRRLRRQDELFVDAVDQQYAELLDSVGESYDLWRAYVFELETFGESYRETAARRDIDARRGSYAAMQQVYASYRKVKLQEEDLRDIVDGFDGEALDTVISTDDGVYRMSGSVRERYEQWRGILSRIYRLEVGLPSG
ncbi:MAG: hypothetical protein V2I82_05230 [Halieaceae bacterium]|jgi:hypothetical protein|nr:hypothetical protein [Halieaceae bacterium]